MIVKVTWDEAKNLANQKAHGISFEEASGLFTGSQDLVVNFPDDDHSDHEYRWKAIGPLPRGLVLAVYTERDIDTLRIISARPATKAEGALYHTEMKGK